MFGALFVVQAIVVLGSEVQLMRCCFHHRKAAPIARSAIPAGAASDSAPESFAEGEAVTALAAAVPDDVPEDVPELEPEADPGGVAEDEGRPEPAGEMPEVEDETDVEVAGSGWEVSVVVDVGSGSDVIAVDVGGAADEVGSLCDVEVVGAHN